MRTPRIVHPEAVSGRRIELAASDLHHLRDVLRRGPGDALLVLDGRGAVFEGRLLGFAAPQVEVGERRPEGIEAREIDVLLAILKGPRMDWAVEKLSELEVRRLIPLRSARGVGGERTGRWRRLAAASARQCGRSVLLEVAEPVDLVAGIESVALPTQRLLLDPEGPGLASRFLAGAAVALACGPEGGFDAAEKQRLDGLGFLPVGLARPTLRAETAAIAAVAQVLALAG